MKGIAMRTVGTFMNSWSNTCLKKNKNCLSAVFLVISQLCEEIQVQFEINSYRLVFPYSGIWQAIFTFKKTSIRSTIHKHSHSAHCKCPSFDRFLSIYHYINYFLYWNFDENYGWFIHTLKRITNENQLFKPKS